MGSKSEVIYIRVGKERRERLERLAFTDSRSLSSMCAVLIAEALEARSVTRSAATGD